MDENMVKLIEIDESLPPLLSVIDRDVVACSDNTEQVTTGQDRGMPKRERSYRENYIVFPALVPCFLHGYIYYCRSGEVGKTFRPRLQYVCFLWPRVSPSA